MSSTKNYKTYSRELLQLALPIIMGNIGFILIGAGDVWVAAKHSTATLAAISIATSITNCIFMFGIGLLGSVSPILSNIRGQKHSAKKYFVPTLKYAFWIALFTTIAILAFVPTIDFMGFEKSLVAPVKDYMIITAFATFGAFLHAALKEFLQAYEIVFFPNFIAIMSVILNVILNYIFVFGYGPIPSMGVVGLALASLLMRCFMGLALLAFCLYFFNIRNAKGGKYYKTLFKVGLPISCAVVIEFVAFNLVAILMGRVAGIYAAAHNLVCLLTSISFMIPLALSNAIAVKVGFSNGAGSINGVKKYSITGVAMSEIFMAASGVIFFCFPNFICELFTNDAELISICIPIFKILAFFQLFDGLQVSLGGIFKGLKRTNSVMYTNLLGYWGIGITMGIYWGIKCHHNLIGFWWGLGLASAVICLVLSMWLIKILKQLKNELSEKCKNNL